MGCASLLESWARGLLRVSGLHRMRALSRPPETRCCPEGDQARQATVEV